MAARKIKTNSENLSDYAIPTAKITFYDLINYQITMLRRFFIPKILICIFLVSLSSYSFSQVTFGEETEPEAEYMFAIKMVPGPTGNLVQCALIKFNSDGQLEAKFLEQDTWAKQLTGLQLSSANAVRRSNIALKKGIYTEPSNLSELTDDQREDWTTQRITSILSNMWRLRYTEYPYKEEPDLVRYREAIQKEKQIKNPDADKEGEAEETGNVQEAGAGQIKLAQGEFDWTKKEIDFNPSETVSRQLAYKSSQGWAANKEAGFLPSDKQMDILKTYGLQNINDFIYGENLYRLMKDLLDKTWQNAYKSATDE